jgi:hypothetical protein
MTIAAFSFLLESIPNRSFLAILVSYDDNIMNPARFSERKKPPDRKSGQLLDV